MDNVNGQFLAKALVIQIKIHRIDDRLIIDMMKEERYSVQLNIKITFTKIIFEMIFCFLSSGSSENLPRTNL